LRQEEIATIRAEIERLQKAQKECADGGIRKQIDEWIAEHKQKPVSSDDLLCLICGKPYPPDECVKNAQGRTMHKNCQRASRIAAHL
jgi:hypothetical protein